MAGVRRAAAAPVGLLLLGACAAAPAGPPPPDPAVARAGACRDAGYAEGGEAYRLCLRVAELEARLEAVESRAARLDLLDPFAFPYYGPFGPYRRFP